MSSTSVKRIMREARELRDPTDQFAAAPLEDNLFEWHFTIAGPAQTAFEGGRFHGRILLPTEYPMKPPSIILLTPNGRFEVGKKICLTISAHHPESWQPSWSIRTMLLAIITFLPTEGKGAIAALDYTDEERKDLAAKSVNWQCPYCKLHMRDALADKAANLSDADKAAVEEMKKIGFQLAPRSRNPSEAAGKADGDNGDAAEAAAGADASESAATADGVPPTAVAAALEASQQEDGARAPAAAAEGATEGAAAASTERAPSVARRVPSAARAVAQRRPPPQTDWSLSVAIMGVVLAIAFLLFRKFTREA